MRILLDCFYTIHTNGNWNLLFCHKCSFLIDPYCQFLCVGHSMKPICVCCILYFKIKRYRCDHQTWNHLVKGHHLYSGTNKTPVINYSREERYLKHHINWHSSSRITGWDESTYIDSIYLKPLLTIVNKHTVELCFILT